MQAAASSEADQTGPQAETVSMMRGNLISAVMLIALSPAALARDATITAPPPEYDIPYHRILTIWRVPSVEAMRFIYHDKDPHASGLAFTAPDPRWPGTPALTCDIYIVDDITLRRHGWDYAWILRHELAHCNGWGVNHAGGKQVPSDTKATMPQLPASTKYLPAYPAVVCITPAREVEDCGKRKPQ
jgi:hypothetical protein